MYTSKEVVSAGMIGFEGAVLMEGSEGSGCEGYDPKDQPQNH